ncbi:MAG: hypothetical protein HY917_01380 [Candidatus Diapherotrites archaeon]|nr:hypothetical protein [Candidatus Diapherotrites archaeon]
MRARGSSFGLANNYHLFQGDLKARTDAVRILTGLANKGFLPYWDIVAPLSKKGKGSVPFDLGAIFSASREELIEGATPTDRENAGYLLNFILSCTPLPKERERLVKLALKTANPSLRAEIQRFPPISRHADPVEVEMYWRFFRAKKK